MCLTTAGSMPCTAACAANGGWPSGAIESDRRQKGGENVTVIYYAVTLFDRTPKDPYGVFRYENVKRTIERYDPGAGVWADTPSLLKYIMNGELGAEQITKREAVRLIKQGFSP